MGLHQAALRGQQLARVLGQVRVAGLRVGVGGQGDFPLAVLQVGAGHALHRHPLPAGGPRAGQQVVHRHQRAHVRLALRPPGFLLRLQQHRQRVGPLGGCVGPQVPFGQAQAPRATAPSTAPGWRSTRRSGSARADRSPGAQSVGGPAARLRPARPSPARSSPRSPTPPSGPRWHRRAWWGRQSPAVPGPPPAPGRAGPRPRPVRPWCRPGRNPGPGRVRQRPSPRRAPSSAGGASARPAGRGRGHPAPGRSGGCLSPGPAPHRWRVRWCASPKYRVGATAAPPGRAFGRHGRCVAWRTMPAVGRARLSAAGAGTFFALHDSICPCTA